MMKRFFFTAALFLIGAGTASADYMLIKINLNKMNFVPTPAMMAALGGTGGTPGGLPGPGVKGGNFAGGFGGLTGGQPLPPDPKSTPVPDDPNAKWVSAWIEVKNRKPFTATQLGGLYSYEHKWSTRPGLVPTSRSPFFPWVAGYVPAETFAKEFAAKFTKEKSDAAANKDKIDKARIVENFLHLARWALARDSVKRFHDVMKEIENIDEKHSVVKNYHRVKKALAQPLKAEDPAQYDLLQELKQGGYKENVIAKKGYQPHFCLYAQSLGSDQAADAVIARRLVMMEDTLEIFYYWFAVQRDGAVQPNFPKYRLNAILTGSPEEFTARHRKWGSPPMVADGFTPRRDNVVVMSNKVRLNDPLYNEFDRMINIKIQDANVKFESARVTFTRDDLLTGKIYDVKEVAKGVSPVLVAAAQTAVVLARHLEEEAERHAATHETVRQLLIASDMFPRNVQIPDWMIEGLAALLETPARALYPTIGAPSWTHGISFHYLRAKTKKLAVPQEVLNNVVRDIYFQDARLSSKDLQDQPTSPELQRAHREAWELARCTAWSFTYYLSQKGKLDYLFNYGKELNRMPRDMDLNEQVLETCFAKAFAMTDAQDAQKMDATKVQYMADSWFGLMDIVSLEPLKIKEYYEEERAKLDAPPPGTPPITSPPTTDPTPDPNQPVSLVGMAWGGSETLPGHGPLSFQFQDGGKVTKTDKTSNAHHGTYTQTGNSVSMQFPNNVVFTGNLSGTTLQGSATGNGKSWNWTVTRGGAANPTINPATTPAARQPTNRPPPPPPPPPRRK